MVSFHSKAAALSQIWVLYTWILDYSKTVPCTLCQSGRVYMCQHFCANLSKFKWRHFFAGKKFPQFARNFFSSWSFFLQKFLSYYYSQPPPDLIYNIKFELTDFLLQLICYFLKTFFYVSFLTWLFLLSILSLNPSRTYPRESLYARESFIFLLFFI